MGSGVTQTSACGVFWVPLMFLKLGSCLSWKQWRVYACFHAWGGCVSLKAQVSHQKHLMQDSEGQHGAYCCYVLCLCIESRRTCRTGQRGSLRCKEAGA